MFPAKAHRRRGVLVGALGTAGVEEWQRAVSIHQQIVPILGVNVFVLEHDVGLVVAASADPLRWLRLRSR